jgi:hypothetical protein
MPGTLRVRSYRLQRNLLALPYVFPGLAVAVFARLRHRPERNDRDD